MEPQLFQCAAICQIRGNVKKKKYEGGGKKRGNRHSKLPLIPGQSLLEVGDTCSSAVS